MRRTTTTQISGLTAAAALALVLFASSPLPAQTPFAIVGVGIGGSLDGIYTSPYQGEIGGTFHSGVLSGGTPTSVICDDFSNNSYVPEYWTAYDTSLSSINAGTNTPGELKWETANSGGNVTTGASSGLGSLGDPYAGWDLGNQETAYDVAAYLAIEIMTCGPTNPVDAACTSQASTTSEQLSYALWELFDATGGSTVNPNLNSHPSDSDTVVSWLKTSPNVDPGTLSAATQDVENAIAAICGSSNCTTTSGATELKSGVTMTALSGYTVNIYSADTSDPITCSGGGRAARHRRRNLSQSVPAAGQ